MLVRFKKKGSSKKLYGFFFKPREYPLLLATPDAAGRYSLYVLQRWFNVRIQLVGASVAVLAGAFVVWWGKDHIEATVAGLALLYALQFTDALKYLVRQHALLEMQMNSVRDNKEKVGEGLRARSAADLR